MTYSATDITPTPRKWVGSFPAALADVARSDKTAHARRVEEILRCLGGGAGGGGFAARGLRAASRFDPRKISGCVLLIDMTQPGSFVESGGTLTSVTNLASGVLWNTAETAMPGYSATGFSSRPAIVFSGTPQAFSSTESAVVSAWNNNNPTTTFWTGSSASTVGVHVFIGAQAPGSARPYRLYFRNATKYSFETIDDSGGADQLKETGAVASTANRVVEYVDTGSNITILAEGSSQANLSYTGGTKTNTRVILGCTSLTSRTNYGSGSTGSIVVHSRELSAAERSYIRVGIGNRWGIAVTA